MSDNSKILMIGTDIKTQGGIASVIRQYHDFGLLDDIFRLPTYKEGSNIQKIIIYLIFLIKYFCILCFNRQLKLIHIHVASRGSFFRKALAIYIAKFFGKKVIFHLHGAEFNLFFEKSCKIIQLLIKNILEISDLILVLSEQWQKDISIKCNNRNIQVLYNPVKIGKIREKNDSETINILFMGRIGKRKGVYDIIKAANLLNNSKIKIYMYGDGEYDEIDKIIKENNLQDRVILSGWIAGYQIEQAYQNADIYILPSYNEGLPMSILEAMAWGLPVISTNVGGIPDAVIENENGYLIKPGDYEELANKIMLLANDKNLRKKMGYKSYVMAREKFDISIVISRLKDYYEFVN